MRDFASRAWCGERDRGGRAVAAGPQIAIGGKLTMRRCWNSKQTMGRAASIAARLVLSGCALQQLPGLALQLKAGVLMGLGAGERGDALHEIENALCGAADYAEQPVE